MLAAERLVGGYAAGRPVLHQLDLEIAPGRLVTLLGANGAGKTTTLRGLIGTLPHIDGSVTVDGQDTRGWGPRRLLSSGVALVPEGRGILVGLTVRENLRMGGYTVRSRAELDRRIAQALEQFPSLAPRLRASAGVLSGGEQQMLAVARALMSKPRYLLLDEPSMGLAPKLVHELMDLIRGLVDGGVGVLLVEQNARAALRVADDAHVLGAGRITMSGPAAELRDHAKVQAAYLGIGA
jgi:branched-chain amino acid transport system ATP-binding protein